MYYWIMTLQEQQSYTGEERLYTGTGTTDITDPQRRADVVYSHCKKVAGLGTSVILFYHVEPMPAKAAANN